MSSTREPIQPSASFKLGLLPPRSSAAIITYVLSILRAGAIPTRVAASYHRSRRSRRKSASHARKPPETAGNDLAHRYSRPESGLKQRGRGDDEKPERKTAPARTDGSGRNDDRFRPRFGTDL